MWTYRRSPGKRLVVVGIGAIAAGAIFLGAGSDGGPAEIKGAPLASGTETVAASTPPASEVAAFAGLAEQTKIPPAQRPIPKPATAPAEIDLDNITLDGDRYVATLADGRRAVLTLDVDLQKLAERLLVEARAPRGAIVVMAPDGRILALAGRKTGKDSKDSKEGGKDGEADWHLATDAWAPAASVFKLVTASALVKAGVDPDDKVCYHGGIRSVLEHNLRDDKRDNRCESLAYGVAHSNNAILGKLAFQKLEPRTLEAEARAFGLGATQLPFLPGAVGALALPAERDLEFAKTAAGFSSDTSGAKLSVVGGALLAATFADDGQQPAPRLVDSIDGAPLAAAATRRVLDAKVARAVGRMMEQTCEGGSAAKSFGKGRRVAGKTGTLTRTVPFYMEHSWFVGYAPVDKPEVVVSVMLGNAESWRLRGHEAARRIIDRVLKKTARAREKDRT